MPRPKQTAASPTIETDDFAAIEALAEHEAKQSPAPPSEQEIAAAVEEAVQQVQNPAISSEQVKAMVQAAVVEALRGAPPEFSDADVQLWKDALKKNARGEGREIAEWNPRSGWVGDESWPIFLGYPYIQVFDGGSHNVTLIDEDGKAAPIELRRIGIGIGHFQTNPDNTKTWIAPPHRELEDMHVNAYVRVK